MTRTKGAFEYKADSEELVMEFVSNFPQTTHAITVQVRGKYFDKINPGTINRLLNDLKDKGRIKCLTAGVTRLWQR